MYFISSFNLTILVLTLLNISVLFWCWLKYTANPLKRSILLSVKSTELEKKKQYKCAKKSADHEKNRNICLLHAKGGKSVIVSLKFLYIILLSKFIFFLSKLYMKLTLKIENTAYILYLRCHKHVITKIYN